MRPHSFIALCALAAVSAVGLVSPVKANPTVAAGYSLTAFASPFADAGLNQTNVAGTAPVTPMVSSPDDIAISGGNVFIGWGNNVPGDGGNGGLSTLAEYNLNGTLEKSFNIQGHLEGIAVDPATGLVYTDQNEDGNSSMTIVNTVTGSQARFGYPNPSAHGGGFDGLQLLNGNLYASASSPNTVNVSPSNPNGTNVSPLIYQVTANTANYPYNAIPTGIVNGNAQATNLNNGQTVTMNNFDPDSLNVTPSGSLIVTNESGAQLTIVSNPGATSQSVGVLNLTNTVTGVAASVDDTGFATSANGSLLFADGKTNVVYALTAIGGFSADQAFSSDKTNHTLDALNFSTGALTPIVTGLGSPAGIAFSNTPVGTPEPASLLTFAAGGAILLLARRRMNAAR